MSVSSDSSCGSASSSVLPALPSNCHFLHISGDVSGIGKSSICVSLLSLLLKNGYSSSELAYIKPATQCIDISPVAKFCSAHGIKYKYDGPVVFYAGFTQLAIDDALPSSSAGLLSSIHSSVTAISKNCRFVLIDGVGFPAVGSCVGISNRDICNILKIPTLIVGKPGVGGAIDAMNFCRDYFTFGGVHVLGAIFNKIPEKVSYHSYDDCVKYVGKYYEKQKFSVYGFVPILNDLKEDYKPSPPPPPPNSHSDATDAEALAQHSAMDAGLVCLVKRPKKGEEIESAAVEVTEIDQKKLQIIVNHFEKFIDIGKILKDLDEYEKKYPRK